MAVSTPSISLKYLVIGILAFGLLSIGTVIYSQWLTSRDFEENASLIRLTQTVQQEIATAHLWFEEALGGDASIDLQVDVHSRIRSTLSLIDGMMERDDTAVAKFETLSAARENLLKLRASIALFDQLVDDRWVGRDSTGIIGVCHQYRHVGHPCSSVFSTGCSDRVEPTSNGCASERARGPGTEAHRQPRGA
jgi:hypothetical protein